MSIQLLLEKLLNVNNSHKMKSISLKNSFKRTQFIQNWASKRKCIYTTHNMVGMLRKIPGSVTSWLTLSGTQRVTDHKIDQYLRTSFCKCHTAASLFTKCDGYPLPRFPDKPFAPNSTAWTWMPDDLCRWLHWQQDTFAVDTQQCDLDTAAMVDCPVHQWVSGHLTQKL